MFRLHPPPKRQCLSLPSTFFSLSLSLAKHSCYFLPFTFQLFLSLIFSKCARSCHHGHVSEILTGPFAFAVLYSHSLLTNVFFNVFSVFLRAARWRLNAWTDFVRIRRSRAMHYRSYSVNKILPIGKKKKTSFTVTPPKWICFFFSKRNTK
jgi:hypothetical protein